MEYTVVDYKNIGELIKRVNVLIMEGWKPQGGIAIQQYLENISGNYQVYRYGHYQAMIRETGKEEDHNTGTP